MNLRQKRDLRRLTRQIIQIIFFLWMPALYTSAFSGVRYVIEPWEMECMPYPNGFRKK